MCEVAAKCTVQGNFWVQSCVEPKNIIACGRHLPAAIKAMPCGIVNQAQVQVRRRTVVTVRGVMSEVWK